MTKNYNVILDTDSYKLSHYNQYPFTTGFVSSYIESRGGFYDKVIFAGLQVFLKDLAANPITMEMIDEAESYIKPHGLPFNRKGWERIVEKFDGRLPILVEAVPEGTRVGTKNVLVQIRNADPEFPWLTSYLETAFLRAVWYPTTVATVSYETLNVIKKYHAATCDDLSALPFSLHDFGARGVSSQESAGLGGVAHLFNSMGTDTLEALKVAREYYGEECAGFSVPASEHSTATAWGREREKEYARHMLETFDGPIISVVSDSYNIFEMVEKVWAPMDEEVKKSGKKIVIRPDSGDPVATLLGIFAILEAKVGFERNSRGYKVLPAHWGVIQGDGINKESAEGILKALVADGWAASNIVFGMGGGLLQQVDRDTQKFAMKASAVIEGEVCHEWLWQPIQKDPITDPGKKSKTGRLILVKDGPDYKTMGAGQDFSATHLANKLRKVFYLGKLLVDETLTDIRGRVTSQE